MALIYSVLFPGFYPEVNDQTRAGRKSYEMLLKAMKPKVCVGRQSFL